MTELNLENTETTTAEVTVNLPAFDDVLAKLEADTKGHKLNAGELRKLERSASAMVLAHIDTLPEGERAAVAVHMAKRIAASRGVAKASVRKYVQCANALAIPSIAEKVKAADLTKADALVKALSILQKGAAETAKSDARKSVEEEAFSMALERLGMTPARFAMLEGEEKTAAGAILNECVDLCLRRGELVANLTKLASAAAMLDDGTAEAALAALLPIVDKLETRIKAKAERDTAAAQQAAADNAENEKVRKRA